MRDGFSTFRRAAAGEAEQVFDLIRQRIAWMDERGIQQWNHPGYLRRYPLDYFRQCAEEGQLYALWTECGVLAAGGRGVGGGPALDRLWREGALCA